MFSSYSVGPKTSSDILTENVPYARVIFCSFVIAYRHDWSCLPGARQINQVEIYSVQLVCLEASFRVTFTHTLAATATALNATQNAVQIACTAPFLMCEDVTTKLALTTLDEVDIC